MELIQLTSDSSSPIFTFADPDLFNDGSANDTSKMWNFASIDLMTHQSEEKVRIKTKVNSDNGRLGLDDIRITTQQRCSPK